MEAFESAILPVLPLKDMVVFPNAISPISVGRPESLAALDAALKADRRLFLVAQKEAEVERPGRDDLYQIGTVCEVLQALRMPDETAKVLVEGIYPARATDFVNSGDYQRALLVRQEIQELDAQVAKAYMRTSLSLFEAFSQLSDKVPEELFLSIKGLEEPLALAHAIANYSSFGLLEKQAILESQSLEEKFMLLNANLEKENQVLQIEDEIVSQVKTQIGRSQREYFLNEQLKAIERELGIGEEESIELDDLQVEIEAAGMSEEAQLKAEKELSRLSRMPPLSPEATVARTYIEWMVEVPWQTATDDAIDLKHAREILDEDHYGLEKVKERIVEYLAVTKLAGQAKGPILCLVGPPGVGKTSLAKSVARSIGRKFARISLGGVRDEAEIRGHRRTYVGAMPGKIIQSMKKAGTINPVMLLDEIDKMSSDFRGDPASAMLEVLDPEQNKTFNDHYLEVDYDLSRVLFITTANTTQGIPLPLQDRMEIIRISGYTDLEKHEIARRHLIPKSIKGNGLKRSQMKFQKAALDHLIHGYTRESGVRNLEREITSLCRKVAMMHVEAAEAKKAAKPVSLTPKLVRELLGPEHYKDTALDRQPEIGNVIGLAWTEVGGELLHVEVRTMGGKGNLTLTGKLGEVMQESGKTALSLIRSQASELGIDPKFHENTDIHVHLPEGAIPKDGPSAGISLATSIVSALSKVPVRQDVAMTGELTLRGKVLKIGGLKEKVLAAYRNRIRTIIMPEENLPDLEEIPKEVRAKTTFITVSDLAGVLKHALAPQGQKKKPAPKVRPRPRTQA